jgi:hypothetical protein
MVALIFILIVAALLSKWVIGFLRFQFAWIVAGPILPAPLDLQSLSDPLRERVVLFIAQLEALGYQNIGACQCRTTRNQISCYAVLVRDEFVAEIAFPLAAKKPTWVMLSQRFTDHTHITVNNRAPAYIDPSGGYLQLPGVTDLSKLDFVAQALVANKRGDRVAIVPVDVVPYKAQDLLAWQKPYVDSKYYYLDTHKNCYRPNRRFIIHAMHASMFRRKRSARLTHDRSQLELNLLLQKLGCGTLQSLRSARLQAFPVLERNQELPRATQS